MSHAKATRILSLVDTYIGGGTSRQTFGKSQLHRNNGQVCLLNSSFTADASNGNFVGWNQLIRALCQLKSRQMDCFVRSQGNLSIVADIGRLVYRTWRQVRAQLSLLYVPISVVSRQRGQK